MAELDKARSEAIGYRKPPLGSQFRPGISGNPRGRPHGSQNVVKVLGAVLDQTVSVTELGVRRRMTKGEALIKVILAGAQKADRRAAAACLTLIEKIKRMTPPSPGERRRRVGIMLVPGVLTPEEWVKQMEERNKVAHGPVTRPVKFVSDDP